MKRLIAVTCAVMVFVGLFALPAAATTRQTCTIAPFEVANPSIHLGDFGTTDYWGRPKGSAFSDLQCAENFFSINFTFDLLLSQAPGDRLQGRGTILGGIVGGGKGAATFKGPISGTTQAWDVSADGQINEIAVTMDINFVHHGDRLMLHGGLHYDNGNIVWRFDEGSLRWSSGTSHTA